MTRFVFTFLLLVSVALFGGLPHASMADEFSEGSLSCHTDPTVMEYSGVNEHCGAGDHAMTGACAVVCLGSFAMLSPSPDRALMTFETFAHHAEISLILHGRMEDTADRPPQSI